MTSGYNGSATRPPTRPFGFTMLRFFGRRREDLWIAGNEHARAPGSELGSTVLVAWRAPGFTAPETGGSTRDVCFMLFGFALENLAKGIIVCRDPKLVSSSRLKRWHGHGHDLAGLFQQAKIAVSEGERMLL